MNISNLSDNELIEYVIKHDDDPIRIRLATHMQRVAGAIIDDLEYAGMDETFCTFRSVVTDTEYLPGQYISHLENEIEYLHGQREQDHKEIQELQARTVAELIQELNQQITTEKINARMASEARYKAEDKVKVATEKLDMWAILNR
jgi:hypothetical protein